MAMKPHVKKRLLVIIASLIAVSLVIGLLLYASEQKMNLFYTPTEVAEGKAPTSSIIRVGGLVKHGSLENIEREDSLLESRFIITDEFKEIQVSYDRVLPDLFKEGKGVVALGRVNPQGLFVATEVLAKHDEEYKAPEVVDALESGRRAAKREQ